MKKNKTSTRFTILFPLSIITLTLGVIILFLGALTHFNPNISFQNLWTREPLMNLVHAILPSIK